jgi:hypothetical protein
MRALLIAVLAAGLFLVGCGQAADSPGALASPAAPTSGVKSDSQAAAAPGAKIVEVPFHSELVWTKTEGSLTSLCTRPLPAGKVYLQRNTIQASAVSTHLGPGEYEGHTCVYGTKELGPEGWFGDMRWMADNGDVLLGVSEFQQWTGVPGRSVAIEKVSFIDGGTGRFLFAEGEGISHVNAPERTTMYEGTLRYGRKNK